MENLTVHDAVEDGPVFHGSILLDRMKNIILNGPKAFLRCVGTPCPSLLSGDTANNIFLG